jgi:hypothetical protein
MDSAAGRSSNAFFAVIEEAGRAYLEVDLGRPRPISRIHMHAVEQSDTVPQAYSGDLGIPKRMRIEAANAPDFSDGIELLEYTRETIAEMGPIIILDIPETTVPLRPVHPLAPGERFGPKPHE